MSQRPSQNHSNETPPWLRDQRAPLCDPHWLVLITHTQNKSIKWTHGGGFHYSENFQTQSHRDQRVIYVGNLSSVANRHRSCLVIKLVRTAEAGGGESRFWSSYIFQLFQSATCFSLGGTLKWRGRHRVTRVTHAADGPLWRAHRKPESGEAFGGGGGKQNPPSPCCLWSAAANMNVNEGFLWG